DVWTSPFRAGARDWLGAAGTLAAGAAVSPLDDNVDRWAVRHQHDGAFDFVSPFREGGAAFSGRTLTPVARGALGLSIATRSSGLQQGLLGCAAAYAASSVPRNYIFYPLIARERPDSGRGAASAAAVPGDQYRFSVPGRSAWG